jgi:ubiquinone biosynthesis protein
LISRWIAVRSATFAGACRVSSTSPDEPVEELSLPVKVRLMLQELGPTYVKMGQIISSRAEVLPAEWARN